EGNTAIAAEEVHTAAGVIPPVRSISCKHLPELAGAHFGAGDHVDRFLGIAVIEAGELRLIALAVEHFYLRDHFGGQVAERQRSIFPEKLLSIEQYPLHIFAM